MSEQWKFVPGTDGRYQISDHGNLQAMWFLNRSGRKIVHDPPKPIRPFRTKAGYRHMSSMVYADGTIKTKGAHVLVLEAFVGPRPNSHNTRMYQAAHENGIAGDDRLANLSWKTAKENAADKSGHGTQPLRPVKTLEDGLELFQCRKCLLWNPRDRFNRLCNKASRCKRESECKDCRREYMRNYMYARAHGLKSAKEAESIERPYRKTEDVMQVA